MFTERRTKQYLNSGQTFLELLIVLVVVGTLVGSIVTLYGHSSKSLRSSRAESRATQLAQYGIELARAARNRSWSDFSALISGGETHYCVGEDEQWTFVAAAVACDTSTYIDGIYERRIILDWYANPTSVSVRSRVSWSDPAEHNVTLDTVLTNW